MVYNKIIQDCIQYFHDNPEQRYGQAVYNFCFKLDKEITKQIGDVFYEENKETVDAFLLEFLTELGEKHNEEEDT